MGLSSIQALLVRLHIHGFLYTSDEGQHACCATLVEMLSTRCSVVSTSHCYWSILCTQIIQFCPVVLSTPPCWDSTLLQRQMSLAWNCEQIMLQFDAMPWEGEEGGGAEGGGRGRVGAGGVSAGSPALGAFADQKAFYLLARRLVSMRGCTHTPTSSHVSAGS